MKLVCFALLVSMGFLLCGASGCEEKIAEKYGIKIKEDPPGSGHYVVIEDPAHGQIGTAVELVKDGTSGTPIAPIGAAVALGSSLLYNILLARAKARAAALNEQHDATHDATALGLQHFVNSQPSEIGKALIQHLDAVHDHFEVPAEHQDLIQPAQKTA